MSATVVAAVVVAVLVLAVLWLYNRLVTLRNRAQAAWHDIDVQLRRRADLIPNLVETVKAYAAHERAVFEDVTAARSESVAARRPGEQAEAETHVDAALARLFAVAEAYPELKADGNFRALQDELVATENKVAFSRQLYNDTVQAYRDATQSLPGVLVARPLGFEPPEFFATSDRSAPRVDL